MSVLFIKGVPEALQEHITNTLGHIPTDFIGRVSVEAMPDQSVRLTWQRAPRWVLSIEIDETGLITYSALFQSSTSSLTAHGHERPVNENLSPILTSLFLALSAPPPDVMAIIKEIDDDRDTDTDYEC